MIPRHIDLHPQVRDALAEHKPVVALESTIIAHGMPWPRNAETALQVQDDVRAHGAVPATIAVIDGRPTVGLSDAQIERLGREGRAAAKLSRRDLAACMARGATGATTVAGTMVLAERAGIAVFATGGIGGVHRGAETSLDISADLHELARTPVAVVCAGAKSILDLPLTLEVLVTLGVPVLGYRTDTLPAFFARDSGLALEQRFDDLENILIAIAIVLTAVGLKAQKTGHTIIDGQVFPFMLDGCGDTVILATLDDVSISSPRQFANDDEYKKYRKYRKFAAEVYPLAVEAVKVFREIEY